MFFFMVRSLMGRASITPVSRMRTREAMLRRCGSLREASEGGLKEASEGSLKEASGGGLKEASEGG
ncbi:unnamed protein product [Meloidogyne enterolobii]|uniref:Uncharacterized protein n=1 Tax=Meloidogyne enterolobii TaxID=390850 RepID=A0ACB0XUR5_MELEN